MATDGTTLKGGGAIVHARTTLVLYHRDGTVVVHLDKGKSLVVGRTAPADVEIPDPGLSRQHARFTWDDAGIWVEDLGSTNGTKKNGDVIERAKVVAGDQIAVGPVMVSVHMIGSIDADVRGFDGHDRFVAALEEEITRAHTFARPLALVMVRADVKDAKEPGAHVSRWADRLRVRLRAVDRVGVYGPTAVLVAVPEATPDIVRALAHGLAGGVPKLAVGAVMFPQDGSSADELLGAVRAVTRSGGAAAVEPADADDVVVKNTAMKDVMTQAKRLASSTVSVLIHGETGTGKEVVSRAIHDGGPRKKQPMRTINCAAIPGMLIESVLFGHEQGAFTGADKASKGIFEQADGGTVFLDEVGELAPPAQAALLRVLETKRITRVGGDREIAVDIRLIAATHRDLEAMVEAGRFRQDLLYRLNTVTLRIPPLRERRDEIRPLAERFLKEARKQGGGDVRSIAPEAIAALETYAWPGNVRELKNVIERAVALAEGKAIVVADLTERVRGGAARAAAETSAPPIMATADDLNAEGGDYREHVRRYEAKLIVQALHRTNGNQTEAAKQLGLPLRTLVHKIQQYGIKKKFDQ
jgi:DNA-binding NtrC family response regulator|nr:sigma 54-interacting transcriptional regulator [Kofleriaceae bacterium]